MTTTSDDPDADRPGLTPQIVVLAGVNGAGKSSIAGRGLRQFGGDYYNPDEATQKLLKRYPGLSPEEANARAWDAGRLLLERAIAHRLRFAFETTLGGRTITGLLLKAANVGIPVRVWYVGLASIDLHIERVRSRVERGGHAIPEERIRERYDTSRENLIRLLPHLTEFRLLDNSQERDLDAGEAPEPFVILHLKHGVVIDACPLDVVPEWAKPIVQAVALL